MPQLNSIDADDPEVSDYHFVPAVDKMSDSVRVCLQESEDVSIDSGAVLLM